MPTIEHEDRRIHYEERGAGTPIVLLHGFLFDREMWEAQTTALAAIARVVVVDLPGHGLSGPVEHRISIAELADDVVAVLDALGIARAVWGGLSLGGMIALDAAIRHPDRVLGLALLGTDGGRETLPRRMKYRLMQIAVRLVGMRGLLPFILRICFGRTTRESRPEVVACWRSRIRGIHVPCAIRVLSAIIRRRSLLARLPDVEVPAVVIVGEEDTALPPRRSRRLAAALPRAELVELPGTGHISSVEAPDEVNRVLTAFVESLRGGTPDVVLLRAQRVCFKFESIQLIRRLSGCGLKAAKVALDACVAGGGPVGVSTRSARCALALAEGLAELGVVSRVGDRVFGEDPDAVRRPVWEGQVRGKVSIGSRGEGAEFDAVLLDGTVVPGDRLGWPVNPTVILTVPILGVAGEGASLRLRVPDEEIRDLRELLKIDPVHFVLAPER